MTDKLTQSGWLEPEKRVFEKPGTSSFQFPNAKPITDTEAYKEIPTSATASDFRNALVRQQNKLRDLEQRLINLDTSINNGLADHVKAFNNTLAKMEQFMDEAKLYIKRELESIWKEIQQVLYQEEGEANMPEPSNDIAEESPVEIGEDPQEIDE